MSCFKDVRYALRTMRQSPGLTAVAVLALALGIGANAAVFTITNAILWSRLPIENPEQIVHLGCRNVAKGLENLLVSYPDFEDWRAQSRSFQGLEAFSTGTMTGRFLPTLPFDDRRAGAPHGRSSISLRIGLGPPDGATSGPAGASISVGCLGESPLC